MRMNESFIGKFNSYIKSAKWLPFLLCLVSSGIMITICSRSSILYPFNDWVDSNCFFTVGKAMFNGKVVYKDIFEQKGILLYFIHGIAYLISNKTFLGMYFYEVISFAVFLYFAYKTEVLFVSKNWALVTLPVISFLILSSDCFKQGDSAEELCLPILMYVLYTYVKKCTKKDFDYSVTEMLILGITAGCVLWIKYTMCGIYIGYFIALFFIYAVNHKLLDYLKSGLVFAGGIGLASLPWLIYFAVTNSFSDMFKAYFYNNMFIYSSDENGNQKIVKFFENLGKAFSKNPWIALFLLSGLILFLFIKSKGVNKIGLIIIAFVNAFFIYIGGTAYEYYFLALSIYLVLGICGIIQVCITLFSSFIKKKNYKKNKKKTENKSGNKIIYAITAVGFVLVLTVSSVASYFVSDNTFMMKYKREELWEYQFADIILQTENPTILNYGCLDRGIYTVTGVVPSYKYFCKLNIPYDEMYSEMDRYIKEGLIDYVIFRGTSNKIKDFILDKYEVVCETTQWYEYDWRKTTYCLLKLKQK